ncbi:MAG: MarR family transcriptional regulator [Hyphomicrobiales bacterium]|nr:MarR family transcriptional regulator [Hyphomicrobiales bacterium]
MSQTLALDVVHEVRDRCLCLASQRAARVLARRFDRAFQPVGLTNNQYSLMIALSASIPMNMRQLAAFLAMDRTTLTAALKLLKGRGLVVVGPDDTDRRARRLGLTEAGRKILDAAIPIWRAEHAAIDAEMSALEARQLRASLGRIGSPTNSRKENS